MLISQRSTGHVGPGIMESSPPWPVSFRWPSPEPATMGDDDRAATELVFASGQLGSADAVPDLRK
jgi:hypothetical protein